MLGKITILFICKALHHYKLKYAVTPANVLEVAAAAKINPKTRLITLAPALPIIQWIPPAININNMAKNKRYRVLNSYF